MPEVDCELYKLIKISGPDSVDFLQGQLTQDVSLLEDEGSLLAAWCNPKGRVIVIMHLLAMGDTTGLVVPVSMADKIVQRLTMYRLRSKVDISVAGDDWQSSGHSIEDDPTALIRAGMAFINEQNSEAYTPHMLNLDKLDAISFTKGCYTGQEVVARTENLGKSKRRLMRYYADLDSIAIVGDKLSDGENDVGKVVNVCGKNLLAVTPVAIHDQALFVDGASIRPAGLPYEL